MKNKVSTCILISPIWLNYFYNKITEFNLSKKDVGYLFLKYLSVLCLFLVLFFIGKAIDRALNINSITVSIILYVMTFYVICYYFMIFLKNYSTKDTFIIYNVFLFVFLVIKSKVNIKLLFYAFSLFLFINIIYSQFDIYNNLIFIDPITNDEIKMWIPRANIISSQNIYEIYNQKIGGGTSSFGLLVHFSFVFLEYIFHFSDGYLLSQAIPNVIFLLFTFFVYENFKLNFYTLVGYLTIVLVFLSSNWFTYIMINSYLGETFSTFYFGVLFYYLLKNKLPTYRYTFILFYLSNLIYSKRFIMILLFVSLIHLMYKHRESLLQKLAAIFLCFSPIIINYYLLEIPLLWVVENEPNNIILYEQPTYNIGAISNIINQFLIDKPLSYFVFCSTILIIYNFKQLKDFERVALSLLSLYVIFVFLYFIFISTFNNSWGDSYRYLINPIYILFFLFLGIINKEESSYYE